MRRAVVCLALLPIMACSRSSSSSEGAAVVPAEPAASPVALFLARDTGGRQTLFQVATDGTVSSVRELEHLKVRVASAAPDGSGGAVIASASGKADEVWRWRSSPAPKLEKIEGVQDSFSDVLDVSRNAEVILALTSLGDLAVIRANEKPHLQVIDIDDRSMYGGAVSPDGTKIAFSVMQKDCASSPETMATCPVTLLGLNLTVAGAEPRRLAGGGHSVAYRPQFLNEQGKRLLYMTNEEDASGACQKHVSDCRYSIRTLELATGKVTTVVDDAVIAQAGASGILSYRRLQRSPAPPERRIWLDQTLIMRRKDGSERVLVERSLANKLHHLSPESKWVLVGNYKRSETFVEVLDIETGSTVFSLASPLHLGVGWSTQPFARGDRQHEKPRSLQIVEEALDKARQSAGDAAVAVSGISDFVYDSLPTKPERVSTFEVTRWLDEHPQGIVLAGRTGFCKGGSSSAAVLWRLDGEIMALRHRAEADDAVLPNGPALASFELGDKGKIELVAVSMPETVKRTEKLQMTLTWRVVTPPPSGWWRVFVHVDHPTTRVNGDHEPDLCPAHTWKPGKILVDPVEISMQSNAQAPASADGRLPTGRYAVHVGLFNFSERASASSTRHHVAENRVEVGAVTLTD